VTRAAPSAANAAIQVFLSRFEDFLGTEMFGGDRPVVIGRHRNANLRLESSTVSKRHCRILLEQDAVYLEDLGSSNGTLVNRRRIEGRVLVLPTDSIQIGPFTLRLRALLPAGLRSERQDSGLSDRDTRVVAVLSADGSQGTGESPLDLGASEIDWRIYEEAVKRATGRENPDRIVPLRLVQGGAVPAQGMDEEDPTREESRFGDRHPEATPAPFDAHASVLGDAFREVDAALWEELSEGELDWSADEFLRSSQSPLGAGTLERVLTAGIARPPSAPRAVPGPLTPGRATTVPERSGAVAPPSRSAITEKSARILARLVTPPTKERAPIHRIGAVPAAPITLNGASAVTEEVRARAPRYEAVEISARRGDQLLDLATIRHPGEQYVLGHRTPQGGLAPAPAHPGLRLVRVNADGQVDLVFPQDVGGHLIRNEAAVTLNELTEGRRYSCLRLEPRDVVTVILGHGRDCISFHVRFKPPVPSRPERSQPRAHRNREIP
jgi:pSer/pThr/pTyr-binding forkhead associated (FHA) protein